MLGNVRIAILAALVASSVACKAREKDGESTVKADKTSQKVESLYKDGIRRASTYLKDLQRSDPRTHNNIMALTALEGARVAINVVSQESRAATNPDEGWLDLKAKLAAGQALFIFGAEALSAAEWGAGGMAAILSGKGLLAGALAELGVWVASGGAAFVAGVAVIGGESVYVVYLLNERATFYRSSEKIEQMLSEEDALIKRFQPVFDNMPIEQQGKVLQAVDHLANIGFVFNRGSRAVGYIGRYRRNATEGLKNSGDNRSVN